MLAASSAHVNAGICNHLRNRSCVINRCCSAASCNSVAASFCIRSRKIASISAALRPVAQSKNIRPNFSSYSRFPCASASRTASSGFAALCSCSLQFRLCAVAAFALLLSQPRMRIERLLPVFFRQRPPDIVGPRRRGPTVNRRVGYRQPASPRLEIHCTAESLRPHRRDRGHSTRQESDWQETLSS